MENSKELKLQYPCNWRYKIILEKEHDASSIAKEILQDKIHTIKKSQNSTNGKYSSHSLEVLVHSNNERKALFEALKKHIKIKFVL